MPHRAESDDQILGDACNVKDEENYKYELHSIIELLKYRNVRKKSSLIEIKL